MPKPSVVLLAILAVCTAVYLVAWLVLSRSPARRAMRPADDEGGPTRDSLWIGALTNFFDTLGIGSFAPTTSLFRLFKVVPDERIPGTMNVGHTPPTILQAFFFISAVTVEPATLTILILASVLGAWLGAGVVASWPRRKIQIGMGVALIIAAAVFIANNLGWSAVGGDANGVTGSRLVIATAGNFILGALMTLGIGMYAPLLILLGFLGMNPRSVFPIMMGSAAFLMVVAGIRFLRAGAYRQRVAVGLTIGGLPAVYVAARIVKEMPLETLRWLVAAVVLYTAVTMLRAALRRE
ncbi:MAG: sulfite exporter TauE/SafE family protein [Gemmatimonadales bacterium]